MFELQSHDTRSKKWIVIERDNDCSKLILVAFERYNKGLFRIVSSYQIEYSFRILDK